MDRIFLNDLTGAFFAFLHYELARCYDLETHRIRRNLRANTILVQLRMYMILQNLLPAPECQDVRYNPPIRYLLVRSYIRHQWIENEEVRWIVQEL